jgi:hypothetical protein
LFKLRIGNVLLFICKYQDTNKTFNCLFVKMLYIFVFHAVNKIYLWLTLFDKSTDQLPTKVSKVFTWSRKSSVLGRWRWTSLKWLRRRSRPKFAKFRSSSGTKQDGGRRDRPRNELLWPDTLRNLDLLIFNCKFALKINRVIL